jgi:hypothetical protein
MKASPIDSGTEMPIRAVPFHHQQEAFRCAMRLFGPPEGGDVPHSMKGAGCALLMEM